MNNSLNSNQTLNQMKAWADRHYVPITSNATLTIIEGILNEVRPKNCLEVGSAIGRGTIHIASTIKKWNGYVFGTEISYPRYQMSRYFLEQYSIENALLYNGDFLSLPWDKISNSLFDFVFIDAEKTKYIEYYQGIRSLLSSHATLVFDDVIEYQDRIGELSALLVSDGWEVNTIKTEGNDGVLVAKK